MIYDPILLEYVDKDEWLLDKDNIIFYLNDEGVCSKKSYFKNVPDNILLSEVIFNTAGQINYKRTLNSDLFINLKSYGIEIIVSYDVFMRAISDKNIFNV